MSRPATRPARRQELELEIDSLAQGGRGVARADGYVVFVSRRRCPGDRVRARLTKAKRDFARGARRRADRAERRPRPRPLPARAASPARALPGRGCPTSASSPRSAQQVDDALRRLGGLDGFELEPIEPAVEPWRYRNKLEYSFGERDGELRARLPPPRQLGRGRRRRGLPCSPRSATTRPATRSASGRAREGIAAYDRAPRDGRAAQPRRPRGPAHRADPDPPRDRAGELSRSRPVDLHTVDRGAGRRHRRARPGCSARSTSREELSRASTFESPTRAFFQTNTEMAERLYGIAARVRRPRRRRARLRPLLRDRDDRARARRAAPARSGGSRASPEAVADAERQRRAQRDRQRPLRRRRRPPRGPRRCSRRPGRPDVVVVDPPRAGLSKKVVRRVLECEARADRLRLLQPDHAGPQRRSARRGRLYAAAREAGRHVPADARTSSAWPCSSGRRPVQRAAASESRPGSTRRSRRRSPSAAQELGYSSMWSNDHPGAQRPRHRWRPSPRGQRTLELGVARDGPRPPPPGRDQRARSTQLGLDRERLWIGVGAGFSEKPLTTMREALPELREAIPGVRLVLAAMGPKMCALAGAGFDGAFFNWMTPEFAAAAREHVERGAARGRPRAAARVRLRPHRRRRRRRGAARQGGVLLPRPPRRLPEPLRAARRAAREPWASPPEPRRCRRHARRYEALDVVVVRGLASASLEAMDRVAERRAPTVLIGNGLALNANRARRRP